MKILASCAHSMRARGVFYLGVLVLAGCGSLRPPARPLVYDFGPGPTASQSAHRMAPLPPLALVGVQAVGAMDSTAVLYRLGYSDVQQLLPYAQARWSMAPADLLRLRLRESLGQRRSVLNPADGVQTVGSVLTLRLELDEFSQLFETPDQSTGLLRARATLARTGAGAEKLVAQRSFVVQRPSTSADAAGGVRALTAAADATVAEIDQWLQQNELALGESGAGK